MGLHHFSHFGVDEPPPFGPMRYHNRIACCDAFAILECGRINFPTCIAYPPNTAGDCDIVRSEEHTSELQSLMRNSYAVFCLKKNKKEKDYDKLTVKLKTIVV